MFKNFGAFKFTGMTVREAITKNGLSGSVPLQSGDLLFSTGTFMEHCRHKTCRFDQLPDGTEARMNSLLQRYPATSEKSAKIMRESRQFGQSSGRGTLIEQSSLSGKR